MHLFDDCLWLRVSPWNALERFKITNEVHRATLCAHARRDIHLILLIKAPSLCVCWLEHDLESVTDDHAQFKVRASATKTCVCVRHIIPFSYVFLSLQLPDHAKHGQLDVCPRLHEDDVDHASDGEKQA